MLTESVTNIVGRADLLGAFGVLAALHAHRKALDAAGGRKALWLAAIALAVTVGMFSKESTDRGDRRPGDLRPLVRARRNLEGARAELSRRGCSVRGISSLTRTRARQRPVHAISLRRQSADRRRLLDRSYDRGQSHRTVPRPADVAGAVFVRLLLQRESAVRLGVERGRLEGRVRPAGVRSGRDRRGGLLAPAPTGVFRHRVFLCHALAHFESGDSHRQHHGGTLSVSAIGGVRGIGSLRGAVGVSATDGAGNRHTGMRFPRRWACFSLHSPRARMPAMPTGWTRDASGGARWKRPPAVTRPTSRPPTIRSS